MYAPRQHRQDKKAPISKFLGPEAEGPIMAPPVYSILPDVQKPEEEGSESEKVAGEKKPTQKKAVGRQENPPQFKLQAGSPFQFKLLAPVAQHKTAGDSTQGGGGENQLPAQVLLMMSNAFGEDFSHVRIVPNSNEAQKAGALAFAQGMDLHFAPGQFNPTSPGGLALIGHELTHVVQQRQGRVQANTEVNGIPVNDDHALEAEADRMGALAAQSIATGMAAMPATPSSIPPVAQRSAAPATPQQDQAPESGEQEEEQELQGEEKGKDLRFSELPPADAKGSGDSGEDETKNGGKENKPKPKQLKKAAQLSPSTTGPSDAAATSAPTTVVDISHGFNPPTEVATYLAAQKKGYTEINARYGSIATGKLKVKQKTTASENGSAPATYAFEGTPMLDYTGDAGFLKSLGIPVVIAFKTLTTTEAQGVLTLKVGNKVAPDPNSLIESINKNLEGLGLLGIEPLKPIPYTNKVMDGTLTLTAPELSTKIGGFADATATFGLVGDTLVFSAKASIHVDGLADGELQIERTAEGTYQGEANIDIGIDNVSGNVKVVYADGKITGRGTGAIESEKFKGSLTLIFDEEAAADQAVYEGMGIEAMEGQENEPPASNGKGPRVVAGFGSVEVQLTPWLSASAMVGIDSKGDVTIHGAMTFPDQVELMEQRDKKHDLFNVELKAGYGVPLVGQIFLFASLGMFVKAGFGPLALHDIGMEGTYSTSPKVPNNFKITGALGISAYAQVGLSVKAGAGLTLIGHDIKAGIDLSASAGIQAYAEARPTFDYIEKATDGQMVGEAHLKGHFEAAARLFLELAGAFFVELDSPWWSPAPDKTWEWPFGSLVYPIGDEMGVAADVDWLVGSPDVPELTFSPVQFDPDKFLSDMTKEPENLGEKGKGGDEKKDGSWTGDGAGGENTAEPQLGDPKDKKKEPKEDLKNLPDEEKYMRALDEVGKIGDAAKGKPIGKGALDKKLKAIKDKYGLGSIKADKGGDETVMVLVTHKAQNNSNKPIEIKLLSKAALDKEFSEAVADLELKLKQVGHPETGAVTKAQAENMAKETDLHFEVIDGVQVTVEEDKVVIKGDVGEGAPRKMATRPLAKGMGDEATGDGKQGEGEPEVKSEADVTDADRKKHKEILDRIKAEVEAPVEETKSFEDLYNEVKNRANRLIKTFQPQLRSGINLNAEYNTEVRDKADGDVDIKFIIAPNTSTISTSTSGGGGGGGPTPLEQVNTAFGSTLTRLFVSPADEVTLAGTLVSNKASLTPHLTGTIDEDLKNVIIFAKGAPSLSAGIQQILDLNTLFSTHVANFNGKFSNGDPCGIDFFNALNTHPQKGNVLAFSASGAVGISNFLAMIKKLATSDYLHFFDLVGTWQASSSPHLAKLNSSSVKEWTHVFHNFGPGSGIPSGVSFNSSMLDSHVMKHMLNHPSNPDTDEPWAWVNRLGIKVTRTYLRSLATSGTINLTPGDESNMFGPTGTGTDIATKAEFNYFTMVFVPANAAIVSQLTNLWRAQYKSDAESSFASATAAFLHTNSATDHSIMVAADKDPVFLSARFSNPNFQISSAYIPTGGAATRMATNAPLKIWDL